MTCSGRSSSTLQKFVQWCRYVVSWQLDEPLELGFVLDAHASPERYITGYRSRRRSVLVVDDIAFNRRVLIGMLQLLGFSVLAAEDGWQALDVAQPSQPDLILMDRLMPVLSGLEAVQHIRNRPGGRGITISATSASVSEADQVLSRDAGYDAFLPKPIAWPWLVALLEQYLQLEWVYADEPQAVEAPTALLPPPEEELAMWRRSEIS